MDSNVDPPVDRFVTLVQGSFALFAVAVFVAWLLIAILAAAVAPDDRPWSFFWCTFLLLGPVGVAVALLAQPRSPEGHAGREGLGQGEYLTE